MRRKMWSRTVPFGAVVCVLVVAASDVGRAQTLPPFSDPRWAPDNGVWEIGVPTSGPGGCHASAQCAGTVLGGDYAPNTDSRLVSPTVTLPAIGAGEELQLRFWEWFAYSWGDTGTVQVAVFDPATSTFGSWQDVASAVGAFGSVAWSRRIVGWAMRTTLLTELVLAALEMAVRDRQPRGVIHHSDHGCQYTSLAFGARCQEAGVRPSRGSVGDCYDNAMCESFFATLECELLDRQRFATPAVAQLAIFDFIEGFYNTRRRHSALGYRSPLDFERDHAPDAAPAVDAAGAVDAEIASTSSLENAQSAFSTAPTAPPPGVSS